MHACLALAVLHHQTWAVDHFLIALHEHRDTREVSVELLLCLAPVHGKSILQWITEINCISDHNQFVLPLIIFSLLDCSVSQRLLTPSHLTARLCVTKPVLEALGIWNSALALLSPSLAAQSLPNSVLPRCFPLSWFRDSVPQKLLLVLWGYCSHGWVHNGVRVVLLVPGQQLEGMGKGNRSTLGL